MQRPPELHEKVFRIAGNGACRSAFETPCSAAINLRPSQVDCRVALIRSSRLSAHNCAFTLEGFSPQVSLVQEQRTSNAQLHDYDRPGEEKMATRDDVAALRAAIESRGSTILRWLGGAVFAAAIAIGFLALVQVFTR